MSNIGIPWNFKHTKHFKEEHRLELLTCWRCFMCEQRPMQRSLMAFRALRKKNKTNVLIKIIKYFSCFCMLSVDLLCFRVTPVQLFSDSVPHLHSERPRQSMFCHDTHENIWTPKTNNTSSGLPVQGQCAVKMKRLHPFKLTDIFWPETNTCQHLFFPFFI